MNLIRDFFARLKSFFSKQAAQGDMRSLDVGEIASRFKLVEEARHLANLGLPAFHSKVLTGTELEVVNYIDGAREQMQRQTLMEMERLERQMSQTQAEQHNVKANLLSADFERQALIIFNEQNSWLDKLGSAAKRRVAELEQFRQEHQLMRDALYPDGAGLFFRYAVLVLLVVFEGVFNASFFAEGLSSGLLGGFLYAALLAGLNVGVTFVFGKTAVRWAFHRQTVIRTLGLLALGVALCFTLVMALSMGHLRAAILAESLSPTKDAWVALLSHPFGLDDLVAWVLFFATVGFGVASLLDGLFIDDLYPGFGAISRRTQAAVEEFEEEFEEVRASLEAIKQDNIDALDQEILSANQQGLQLLLQLNDHKATYQAWVQTLSDSEIALYAALRIFRAENERARHDALRPSYFDTLPTLRPIRIPAPDLTKFEQAYQELTRKAKTLENTLPQRRAKVYQLFDAHIAQLNFIKQTQKAGAGGQL